MMRRVHAVVGAAALLCIAGACFSTVLAEVWFSSAAIVSVKRGVLWSMAFLVPALAVTGGSGFVLGTGRRGHLIAQKSRRMIGIALIGLLVQLPAAIYLHFEASSGVMERSYYAVQAVELGAGLINLYWLARSFVDGLRLSGRIRGRAREAGASAA